MKEELVKRLVALHFKNARVEKDLELPKNSLSAVLNGHKSMPEKWIEKVKKYLLQHEEIATPAEIVAALDADRIGARINQIEWVSDIEAFCQKHGVAPADIIKWYKTPEMAPKSYPEEGRPSPDNWDTLGRIDKLKWLTANPRK